MFIYEFCSGVASSHYNLVLIILINTTSKFQIANINAYFQRTNKINECLSLVFDILTKCVICMSFKYLDLLLKEKDEGIGIVTVLNYNGCIGYY